VAEGGKEPAHDNEPGPPDADRDGSGAASGRSATRPPSQSSRRAVAGTSTTVDAGREAEEVGRWLDEGGAERPVSKPDERHRPGARDTTDSG